MNLDDCKILTLPKITDPRGNLTFIEENRHVPFTIKRVYYIYDVPTGESRGGHAHKTLHEVMVCLSGTFEVKIDDGENQKIVQMNRPWQGLYLPPLIWAHVINFAPASVCMLVTSDYYDSKDYYYDYQEFLAVKRKMKKAAV